jgi:putative transposase
VKRKKHTPEQIVKKLREAEMELAKGANVADVSRRLAVSEQTYYRWKQMYGGGQGDQQVKTKELERQNARLKKIASKKW